MPIWVSISPNSCNCGKYFFMVFLDSPVIRCIAPGSRSLHRISIVGPLFLARIVAKNATRSSPPAS